MLDCTILCCPVLCPAVLYCTVIRFSVRREAVLCSTALCCTVLCCTVLYCTALHCVVLCCAVLYCYCTALYRAALFNIVLCRALHASRAIHLSVRRTRCQIRTQASPQGHSCLLPATWSWRPVPGTGPWRRSSSPRAPAFRPWSSWAAAKPSGPRSRLLPLRRWLLVKNEHAKKTRLWTEDRFSFCVFRFLRQLQYSGRACLVSSFDMPSILPIQNSLIASAVWVMSPRKPSAFVSVLKNSAARVLRHHPSPQAEE